MEDRFYWNVGKIPFIYNILEKPNNDNIIPGSLQFNCYIDERTGTLTYDFDNDLFKQLNIDKLITYKDQQTFLNDRLFSEVLSLSIQKIFNVNRFPTNFNILQVGCNDGYLLYKLRNCGAGITGIDPKIYKKNDIYKLNIINEKYPSNKLKGFYDLIIFYSLENLEDPINCLRNLKGYLKKDGKIIVVVNDNKKYFNNGDISIFKHNHLNYYTRDSLKRSLEISGFKNIKDAPIKIETNKIVLEASAGSNLYLVKKINNNEIIDFKRKYEIVFKKFLNFILDNFYMNNFIGIFQPLKLINLLSLIQGPYEKLRFFDEDSFLHYKYFPSINIQIESVKDLFVKPTNIVLITNTIIGDNLKKEFSKFLPRDTKIDIINEHILNI